MAKRKDYHNTLKNSKYCSIMLSAGKIYVIVRAYIREGDYVLVANSGSHLFLLGGHVRYQETVYQALLREIAEEIGTIDPIINDFIGVVENLWDNNGKPFHEQSFVFKVHSHSLSKNKEVISKEQHLTFHWEKFSNLAHKNFLPIGMYDFLKEYEEQKQPKFFSLIKDQFTTKLLSNL
ncbi:NUDIX domain-containing protein [Candidatus Tisiphia endosymbiont of Thecophora atra]|uniref:NUDIX domain-containing protein n=1 Tax=Candidatus Tisiphia endosymbiont of Thecophora atra TaxID=3066258 RepID=UPI00312C7A36